MAVPKQKTSKANSKKRRTHWKLKTATMVTCPECHEAKLPHRICPNCGYYKGREVKQVSE